MYDIITLGSATVDVFVNVKEEVKNHKDHQDILYHLGSKMLVDDLVFTTGGGGTNTAVAFSRLGLKTGFLGIVGSDANGELILQELYKEGVDFLGKIKNGKTGYSIVLPGPYDRVILSYKGVNNELISSNLHLSLLHTKWLYVSTLLGKSLDSLPNLFNFAKQHGIKVAFNLSEYLARQGLNKLKDCIKNADILILNKEEASFLTGKKEIEEIVLKISKVSKGVIVITDSYRPIYAYHNGTIYKKSVKKIIPKDNTGAGDAFASGFVYGIMSGKGIENALDYGCKEASSVLTHIGAKNNLPRHL